MEPLSLHFVHEKAHARFSEVGGREVVAAYGDDGAQEYRAAREAVAVHDASYRECVRLTGEDRASFLHGMVTQDVKGLAPGATAYATMVTVKGAMVADARLVRREQDLLLDVEPGAGARVREFLEKYLISEDAELHDASAELALLRLLGPRTPELLSGVLGAPFAPLAPGASRAATLAGTELLLLGAPATGGYGVAQVDLLLPRASLEAVWAALTGAGAQPLGFEALEVLRVEAGTPRFGQDLVETTIPLEANLAHAISYNKGCYIGQEVIARATFRGHMNRTLSGFLLGEAPAAAGAELLRDGKRVGWLTSVVRSPRLGQWVALGYVRREVEAGTQLPLGEGPRTATVQPLPFA